MEPSSKAKCIGILTSGGDAQGMNAAVRATVRMALLLDMTVYGIKEGYQGLVNGDNCIQKLDRQGVSRTMHRGGTFLGTARCEEFREREGRLKAAKNLLKFGINNLVVIGGDGSLTGANIFKQEWKGLLETLLKDKEITEKVKNDYPYLNIVGMVGSIDNDMHGTDMTIGTDSALHRIIEAVDCIKSTAGSHQRSFVIEVMGRHCGYLALMSGIAGAANWVLIPENPPKKGWEKAMCTQLNEARSRGCRSPIVIIAEGAIDQDGKPISSDYVRQTLRNDGHDVRTTVLGHIQRGGSPSAFDRILGCRMGAEAAIIFGEAKGEIDPVVVTISGNEIVTVPLMTSVKDTQSINAAMNKKEFDKAVVMRGKWFQDNLKNIKRLNFCVPLNQSPPKPQFRFAVLNIGAPACGMNSALYTFVRLLLGMGHVPLCIENGFEGLLEDLVTEMTWIDVDNWNAMGGSNVMTNRTMPTAESLPKIAEKFKKFNIQGLYLVGGFEGYASLIALQDARCKYPEFRIPLLGTSATISNNVPGSDYSLGSDTALNTIVASCDMIKQSSTANRKRVFVVETMGGYCGYLATMAGLAAGADAAYIHEKTTTVRDLQSDVDHLKAKFEEGIERGLVLRNEKFSEQFTTDFIVKLFQAEGEGVLQARSIVLGHLQQGGNPSPYDRIYGAKISARAVEKIVELAKEGVQSNGGVVTNSPESACMVGITGKEYTFMTLEELKTRTDTKHRRSKEQWWMKLRPLLRNLAGHQEVIFKGERRSSTGN